VESTQVLGSVSSRLGDDGHSAAETICDTNKRLLENRVGRHLKATRRGYT
jgi:hypothetical protein